VALSPPDSSKITSPGARDNAATSAPSRAELGTLESLVLKQGGPTKADLYIVDRAGAQIVIKDFAHKAWWVRLVGRVQISRECGAYRWLGPRPFLPRFAGRIDAHALAMERIAARELALSPLRRERGAELLERLRDVVRELHDAGLAHLDLRGRENVLVAEDGRIFVLDLASAVRMRPGGLAYRLLFRRFAVADAAAVLKWKRLLDAGPYTEEEQLFLARFRFWRGLWPFNRKTKRR
jgi:hypothetical protein